MIDMISLVLKVILSIAPCASNWRCNVCKKVKVEHWEFLCKKIKEISEKKKSTQATSVLMIILAINVVVSTLENPDVKHILWRKMNCNLIRVFSEKLWTPISLDHSQVCVFKSGIASNRAHSALLDSIIWDRDITTYNANEKI